MADSRYQRMQGRYEHAATHAAEATSFIRPEILDIPAAKLQGVSRRQSSSQPFRLQLERLIRYKPHTLTPRRREAARDAERDGRRGRPRLPPTHRRRPQVRHVQKRKGRIESSFRTPSFSSFLRSPDRNVRRKAFHQYYAQFQGHENSLAAALLELGAEGRLLRQGPQLPERPRGVAVSRQRAGRACTTI